MAVGWEEEEVSVHQVAMPAVAVETQKRPSLPRRRHSQGWVLVEPPSPIYVHTTFDAYGTHIAGVSKLWLICNFSLPSSSADSYRAPGCVALALLFLSQ